MSRTRQEPGQGCLRSDVTESVLARLPVHVLCRFRLVCRTWNHLISQSGFASLCALGSRQASYIFISPRLVEYTARRRWNWEILDMVEARFYILSDSFIEDYLHSTLGGRERRWSKYTLGADGGLIYAMYIGDQTGVQRHFVCNPVTKSFHQITEPRFHFSYDNRDAVVMSVDKATQEYKIITMDAHTGNTYGQEEMYSYDSTTTQWTKLCVEVPDKYRPYSRIFREGILYTLFVDTSLVPWCLELYSCDVGTGAWSRIDVKLPQPSHPQDKSQLVVSLGRLFLVEYTGLRMFPFNVSTDWEVKFASYIFQRRQLIHVTIWEILLAEKEVVKVAEMKRYERYEKNMVVRPQDVLGDPMVAVGFGEFVVISSLLGRRLGFDLVKNRWEELPANSGHMHDNQGIYSGLLDLNLREMRP